MVETYCLPTAIVLTAVADGDVATVAIRISQEDYLSYPIAPASLRPTDPLLQASKDHACQFELHQLIARDGTRLVFETYSPTQSLPAVGNEYTFGSWWSHWAMDAARDLSADWKRLAYPADHTHAHCLFTGVALSSSAGQREGYYSYHGWITIESYEEFIERDRFRIRRDWRSCEIRPSNFRRIDK